MNRRDFRNTGFTMLELVTVIGIIAILAALLLAGLAAAKRRGQSTVCQNNVRQLGMLLISFVGDHHEYPLFLNYSTNNYDAHQAVWGRSLGSIAGLNPAGIGSASIFFCPRATKPKAAAAATGYESYGYNVSGIVGKEGELGLGLGGKGGEDPRNPFAPPVREGEVAAPSHMIAIGDSFEANLAGLVSDGDGKIGIAFWVTERIPGSQKRSAARHDGFGNFVFCDGHVEQKKIERLLVKVDEEDARLWNRDDKAHAERIRGQ